MRSIVAIVAFLTVVTSCAEHGPFEIECGPSPQRPNLAVTFTTTSDGVQYATMSRSDYLAYEAYVSDLQTWSACLVDLNDRSDQ